MSYFYVIFPRVIDLSLQSQYFDRPDFSLLSFNFFTIYLNIWQVMSTIIEKIAIAKHGINLK
ncbi:hypothetical protein [Oscillatoria salina]|uniref:hypothetical protein n=1 Tax=Oscillatoria salina TaxID=331517 RepID=UPI0013B9E2F0|nr:hypothetical protein [Oscillatoria salina]MBZ8178865.1 hypothetical protein [Oscillatoria salina IIICB1]NET86709.1 hypothetical protein [Kamptonema sp. SIO1D9]